MKNEGDAAQRVFRSLRIPYQQAENITIVLFRATSVTVVDLVNPQTLNEYSGVEMITREGMVPFERVCKFGGWRLRTTFLEPHRWFYVKLQSGAADNELVKVTRAFAMNVENTPASDLEDEFDGVGYLVADTPFLLDIAAKSANSMFHVNGRRLDLQNRYGMADARTNAYHEKVREQIAESRVPGLSKRESTTRTRDAVTYATLNHPVLRESIFEAVVGILWYLALLVPFVFFFEKLLFIEQPLHRDVALEESLYDQFQNWPDRPPVIIDESDGQLDSLSTGLRLGYAGTSHKNCKGIFKGITNRCLIAQRTHEGETVVMSGEDLCNVGPVALLQDLAVCAVLGIESVERNGHHYHSGLSQLPMSMQEATLEHHADLYHKGRDDWPTLNIQKGRMSMESINKAPFGVGFEIAMDELTSASDWEPPIRP